MAGDDKQIRNSSNNSAKITILQCKCRGFKARTKRAALRIHLTTLTDMPVAVAFQELGDDATLTNFKVYQRDAQTAICVHQNFTATPVDLDCHTVYSYAMVTLLPLSKEDPSLHILNMYSSPKLPNVTYADIFNKSLRVAGKESLVVVGDFNAPSPLCRYRKEEKRGRKMAELIPTLGLTLNTDPAQPTRIGKSVTRDTCPDLTLTKNIRYAGWLNTEETLGSDH